MCQLAVTPRYMRPKNDIDKVAYDQALATARAESMKYFLGRFRAFGKWFGLLTVILILCAKGMPLYEWWDALRVPVVLLWMALLLPTAVNGGMALGKWLMIKGL